MNPDFSYLDVTGADLSKVTKELKLPDTVSAPLKKSSIAGKAVYKLDGKEIGSVNILFKNAVDKASFRDYFKRALDAFFVS